LGGALVLGLLGPVQAQDAAATPGTTWYVHNFTSPDGVGAFLGLLPPTGEADQTSAPDPQPTPYVIPISTEAPLAGGYAAVGTAGEAVMWVKGFNNAPAPQEKVTIEVLADATSLAKGSLTQDILPTAPIVEFRIPLTFTATALAAGTKLTMKVTLETAGCGCYTLTGYPRGVSPDHPWQMRLPFVSLGGSSPTLYTNVTTAGFTASAHLVNATTQAHHYNWTQGPAKALFILDTHLLAGNLTIAVRDAANHTLLDLATSINGTTNRTLEGAPGTWGIWVNATALQGNYTANLVPLPTNATASTTTTQTGTGTSRAATTDSTTSTTKGAPGLGLVAVAVLLALVAWRRRD